MGGDRNTSTLTRMWLLLVASLLSAPNLRITVEAVKPLKVQKGQLMGVLAVKLKNGSDAPVTLQHRDVNGFRFVPEKGGPPLLLFHSCDCGLETPPPNRTVTLQPGEERVIRFDDFGCGGGPYRFPPKGRYTVTWQATSEVAPAKLEQAELKECERLLLAETGTVSAPTAITIR